MEDIVSGSESQSRALTPYSPIPNSGPSGVCNEVFFLENNPNHTKASEGLGMRGDGHGGNGSLSSHLCFIFIQIQVERPCYTKDERLGLASPTFGGPAGNCLGSKEPRSTLWR